MKNLLYIFIILACICLPASAQQGGGDAYQALDAKVDEYLKAIETSGAQVQKEECDFLIENCPDSLMRQHVALRLYDHYMFSDVMGSEAVAIHIFDEWFSTGRVKMPQEQDLLNARVYADFNRQSQIGMKAPSLDMVSMDGEYVRLFKDSPSRYTVLYFYDTDCPKCKLETRLLAEYLAREVYPLDVYAIYAGDDYDAWRNYVSEEFRLTLSGISLYHLWDPELGSDFQKKYAVVQTPRMYLVGPDGVIAGRGLDASSLSQLLDVLLAEKQLDYGSDESIALFDMVLGDSPTIEQIDGFAENIERLTIAAGDTLMYRQLVGDFMYYLSARSGEVGMEGLAHLIDRHILTRNDVWKTEDDSLKVIGFAQIMEDLLSKAEVGSLVADIKVKGELSTSRRTKTVTRNLRRLRGKENIIIFHTEGCNICAAEMKAASSIIKKNPQVKVFSINMDEAVALSPSLAARLFDAFDLTVLPYIIITDRKGTILRRYVSLQ